MTDVRLTCSTAALQGRADMSEVLIQKQEGRHCSQNFKVSVKADSAHHEGCQHPRLARKRQVLQCATSNRYELQQVR